MVARQKNMQSQQGKETEFYRQKHNPLGFFFIIHVCICTLATIAAVMTSYTVVNAAKHNPLNFSYWDELVLIVYGGLLEHLNAIVCSALCAGGCMCLVAV